MAERHTFQFWGGEKLTIMGATWFVAYAYYDIINPQHKNWEKVQTWKSRKSVYCNTKMFHEYWLEKIEHMNDDLLKTNKIGLSPTETKRMAREILERMNEE